MLRLWIPTVMALAFSHNALAGEGDITPVKIERLAIIATATGGHLAGNMEIKILGGFKLPVGVFCDTNYITTKKTTDPDRAMFNMLLTAQTTTPSLKVRLRITDDAALTAFPGRCSIQVVDVF
jgi:hypothetical protein